MGKTISSELLGSQPMRFGDQTGELDIYDGLRTPISDDVIELSERHAQQINAFATLSAQQFGDRNGNKEPTKVQTEVGVPSLVVRIDATIINGEIAAYEMEDSPSGQGITDRLHRAVAGTGIRGAILDHYDQLLGDVPRVIISGERTHGTDDVIIVGDDKYAFDQSFEAKADPSEPVIVKTIPGNRMSQDPYIGLQGQAVAPLVTEGDKSYLERMGVLAPALADEDLLIDNQGNLVSQVLKSRMGSMAMGVSIFLTNEDKKQFTSAGTVTASKLRSRRQEYTESKGGALVQPFMPPIAFENPEKRSRAILRIFALLDPEGARVIGGCYVARPGMVVHGASDAISGPVLYNGENNL